MLPGCFLSSLTQFTPNATCLSQSKRWKTAEAYMIEIDPIAPFNLLSSTCSISQVMKGVLSVARSLKSSYPKSKNAGSTSLPMRFSGGAPSYIYAHIVKLALARSLHHGRPLTSLRISCPMKHPTSRNFSPCLILRKTPGYCGIDPMAMSRNMNWPMHTYGKVCHALSRYEL